MNDIVNTGPSTALGTLKRDGDQVKASGYSQVVHLDAVRVNDPALASLLQTVTGQDFSNQALATVEGIQANADVALDGKSKGVETANGTLARVVVLGHAIDTNSVLSPGTSCTVSIPGRSTCGGSLSAINIPDVTGGAVGSLLTVTLTRGIYSPSANNSPTFGEAKIVTLEVTANLNLPALEKLAATVPAAAQVLGLVTGHAGIAGLATVGLGDGSQPLLDAQFGVAAASVSLNTSQSAINPPGQPAVPPPNTGNDVLPLALLALALLAGGIGMSLRKGRFQRG
jgi:hypothetical protein